MKAFLTLILSSFLLFSSCSSFNSGMKKCSKCGKEECKMCEEKMMKGDK